MMAFYYGVEARHVYPHFAHSLFETKIQYLWKRAVLFSLEDLHFMPKQFDLMRIELPKRKNWDLHP